MDQDELIKRLEGYEWKDIEFKKAQRGVPNDAYETVSAFSNTAGGWLVFGVQDDRGRYEIVGVLEVDKVQNDFLSALRTGDKLNRVIATDDNLLSLDDKTLLVFYIPEARRQEKPVYLKGDIRKSFIRRGGCDERCTQEDIERFIRDASEERYDGRTIDLDPEYCFDADAVQWYRAIFNDRNPGKSVAQTDLEFLHNWGFLIEDRDTLRPTCAAILLFGLDSYFRQSLPRPVVDCQWIQADADGATLDQRWADRLVIENNLIQTWRFLIARYMHHVERPFQVDPATLRREDAPPDYIAFREAAINLLIHQDYADHTRKPEIRFFQDCTVFWNPGDAFVSEDELLEPGEKEVRNPRIVGAFRRIGLSEQAGTGVRAIFSNWQQLGYVPPVIQNDKEHKTFRLVLLTEPLLSEDQLLFHASLGVHLSEQEAKVFAYACRKENLYLVDVKAVTGLSGSDAQGILDQLVVQALISPVERKSPYFVVSEHIRDRFRIRELEGDQARKVPERLVSDQPPSLDTNLVSDQPQILQKLSEIQWKIVMLCDVPRAMADIMDQLGLSHRSFFRRKHLTPLLKGSVLRMTHPEQANHPDQAYVLTEGGVELKASRLKDVDRSDKEE